MSFIIISLVCGLLIASITHLIGDFCCYVGKPNMDVTNWCCSINMCMKTQFASYKLVLLDQIELNTSPIK
jgi:hypothetical protein